MKIDLRITMVGVGMHHERAFHIDRPAGAGEYVFLHFLTPAVVRYAEGYQKACPGDCLFFSPGFPHWYQGDGVGLGNDCFHFTGAGVPTYLRAFGLTVNRVLHPAQTSFVAPLLREMRDEMARRESLAQVALALCFERLCLHLSRQLNGQVDDDSPLRSYLLESFRELRSVILERFTEDWDVPSMARRLHLGQARFSALYKQFFGITPLGDLIERRLEHARWLLTNTSLPIGDVAGQSGFKNVFYFSRLFHHHVGCPPREYYRKFSGRSAPTDMVDLAI